MARRQAASRKPACRWCCAGRARSTRHTSRTNGSPSTNSTNASVSCGGWRRILLAELALSLITRAPVSLRRLGLVQESIGLWSRSRRQKRAWQPHYARCRDFVAAVVEELAGRRTVLVLGSGLVRDVPIELLAGRFERVVLLDAVHLPMVRFRMRRFANVTLVTRDLTGTAGWLAGTDAGRVAPLADFARDGTVDLVVSANLLSQLPLPVANRLADHPAEAKRFPDDLPARIVGWHLADLSAFGCRVCLLTDVEMREEDRKGTVTSRLDLMRGHKLPRPDAEWDWTVAPFGEIDRDAAYVHHVRAYRDFRGIT